MVVIFHSSISNIKVGNLCKITYYVPNFNKLSLSQFFSYTSQILYVDSCHQYLPFELLHAQIA
jgi:hypothetical protein